jgi:hypothetical protein
LAIYLLRIFPQFVLTISYPEYIIKQHSSKSWMSCCGSAVDTAHEPSKLDEISGTHLDSKPRTDDDHAKNPVRDYRNIPSADAQIPDGGNSST